LFTNLLSGGKTIILIVGNLQFRYLANKFIRAYVEKFWTCLQNIFPIRFICRSKRRLLYYSDLCFNELFRLVTLLWTQNCFLKFWTDFAKKNQFDLHENRLKVKGICQFTLQNQMWPLNGHCLLMIKLICMHSQTSCWELNTSSAN
jgi:hypothetical protein